MGAIFGIFAYHKKTTTEFSNIERILPLLISLLVSSMFISNTNWARFMLLLVVATGFFLYAGEGAKNPPMEKKKKQPLYFRLLSYLGKISYSLYLIHWPVVLLISNFIPSYGFMNKGLKICSSIILGHVLWRYIETPFQRIRITNKLNSLDSIIFEQGRKRKEVIFGIPAVLILFVFVSTFPSNLSWVQNNSNLAKSAKNNTFLKPFADYENQFVQGQNSQVPGGPDASKTPDALPAESLGLLKNTLNGLIQSNSIELKNAQSVKKIPLELKNLFNLIGMDKSNFEKGVCPNYDTIEPPKNCNFISPKVGIKKRLVIVGDSKVSQFVDSINNYFLPKNWDVYSYAMNGCNPFVPETLKINCSGRLDWIANNLKLENFDLLIFTGYPAGDITSKGKQYLVNLIRDSKKTILLGVTTKTPDPKECVSKDLSIAEKCNYILPAEVDATRKISSMLSSLQSSQVGYIDTTAWSCIAQFCPVIIGNTFATRDGSHLTRSFTKKIEPIFFANLDVPLLELNA